VDEKGDGPGAEFTKYMLLRRGPRAHPAGHPAPL